MWEAATSGTLLLGRHIPGTADLLWSSFLASLLSLPHSLPHSLSHTPSLSPSLSSSPSLSPSPSLPLPPSLSPLPPFVPPPPPPSSLPPPLQVLDHQATFSYWFSFLPDAPRPPNSSPSLLTCILKDPLPKVRTGSHCAPGKNHVYRSLVSVSRSRCLRSVCNTGGV